MNDLIEVNCVNKQLYMKIMYIYLRSMSYLRNTKDIGKNKFTVDGHISSFVFQLRLLYFPYRRLLSTFER